MDVVGQLKELCDRFGGIFEAEEDIGLYTCYLDNLFTGKYIRDPNVALEFCSDLSKLLNNEFAIEPLVNSKTLMRIGFAGEKSYETLDVGEGATGMWIMLYRTKTREGTIRHNILIQPIKQKGKQLYDMGCRIDYKVEPNGKSALARFVCDEYSDTKISSVAAKIEKRIF